MKYCPNCGKELRDDAKFCSKCGKEYLMSRDVATKKKRKSGRLILAWVLLLVVVVTVSGAFAYLGIIDWPINGIIKEDQITETIDINIDISTESTEGQFLHAQHPL